MNQYTFAVDPGNKEITVTAESEKQARKQAWDSLTDGERNAVTCLECVEVIAA